MRASYKSHPRGKETEKADYCFALLKGLSASLEIGSGGTGWKKPKSCGTKRAREKCR